MTDKYHNKQAHELIEAGAIEVVAAEGKSFEGYLKLAAGLHRHMAKYQTTQKATAELRKIIENAQLKGKSFRTECENLLVGIPGNPADSKRASTLRAALIWMHEQPKQLAFVLERLTSANPTSLHGHWKKHQSAVTKEAMENGDDHRKLADALEGVTQKEAKEMLTKATKAKEAREAKAKAKAEAEVKADPAPAPMPAPEPNASALLMIIETATFEDLEALERMIARRKAALEEDQNQFVKMGDADLTKRFQNAKHTFCLYSKMDYDKPVLTGRVLKKERKIILFDDDHTEIELDVKTPSAKTVRRALFSFLNYNNLTGDITHDFIGIRN